MDSEMGSEDDHDGGDDLEGMSGIENTQTNHNTKSGGVANMNNNNHNNNHNNNNRHGTVTTANKSGIPFQSSPSVFGGN